MQLFFGVIGFFLIETQIFNYTFLIMNVSRYINLGLGVLIILLGMYNFYLHGNFTIYNSLLFIIGLSYLVYYGIYLNRKILLELSLEQLLEF